MLTCEQSDSYQGGRVYTEDQIAALRSLISEDNSSEAIDLNKLTTQQTLSDKGNALETDFEIPEDDVPDEGVKFDQNSLVNPQGQDHFLLQQV